MKRTPYNGWWNRATWNVNLWLTGNDETTYREATKVATKPRTLKEGAETIREFCERIWGEVTPDGDKLAECKWIDVARGLREK